MDVKNECFWSEKKKNRRHTPTKNCQEYFSFRTEKRCFRYPPLVPVMLFIRRSKTVLSRYFFYVNVNLKVWMVSIYKGHPRAMMQLRPSQGLSNVVFMTYYL